MAKHRTLPLASATVAGLAQLGAGIASPTPGLASLVPQGGHLWVSSAGNDTTGDGSAGKPYKTLAVAFAWALAAGTPFVVHLPQGAWQEAVALPPPGVTLQGAGVSATVLSGVGGAQLSWTEGAASTGLRGFRDITVLADIAGLDGGSLELVVLDAYLSGTLTLVGATTIRSASAPPTLVNCCNVHIVHTGVASTLTLSYDPTAGSNGPGPLGPSCVYGGMWTRINYDSTDASAELHAIGVEVGIANATQSAVLVIQGMADSLISKDAGSVVKYRGSVHHDAAYPTYSGLGSFDLSEFILDTHVAANAGEHDISIAVPRLTWASTLRSCFFSSTLPGLVANFVSATLSSITIHVLPPAPSATHVAYDMRILVKP